MRQKAHKEENFEYISPGYVILPPPLSDKIVGYVLDLNDGTDKQSSSSVAANMVNLDIQYFPKKSGSPLKAAKKYLNLRSKSFMSKDQFKQSFTNVAEATKHNLNAKN